MFTDGAMSHELDFVLQQMPFSERQVELNSVKLPLILKNKSLMPPGTYNGFYFSADVIKKGFDASDWNLKEVRSLYEGHPSDPVPGEWVGEIQNPYFDDETGTIMGDVVIVDPANAVKLSYGAKFGISPSIEAITDSKVVKRFSMRNFGLVIQPAMVRNYLNNSLKQEDNNMEGENQILEAITSLKTELVSMKQDIETLKKSNFDVEVTDLEMLDMAKGGFVEFYKEFLKKYPDATMKDAAKAYKKSNPKEYPYPVGTDKTPATSDATPTPVPCEEKKVVENAQVEDKPAEAKEATIKINNSEQKPSDTEALVTKIAELESKINKPVIESSTTGNQKSERLEDVNTIFFQWIKKISGD
jgi:hypothetical protein